MIIPADVPVALSDQYKKNYEIITKKTKHCALLAGDQKVEHLQADFYGPGIHPDVSKPHHLFELAQTQSFGVFATHLGAIARYGKHYADVPYLVKLDAKTNIISLDQKDPESYCLWSVDDAVALQKDAGLNIAGVGFTVYLGSRYEANMLYEAAQIVYQAHQAGMLAILWMYPRGEAVEHEYTVEMLAGAVGVANSLGADFVKIHAPEKDGVADPALLHQVVLAAGNTGVLCAGGSRVEPKEYLELIYQQMHVGGVAGCAVGRNVYQYSLEQAKKIANAVHALVYEQKTLKESQALL